MLAAGRAVSTEIRCRSTMDSWMSYLRECQRSLRPQICKDARPLNHRAEDRSGYLVKCCQRSLPKKSCPTSALATDESEFFWRATFTRCRHSTSAEDPAT